MKPASGTVTDLEERVRELAPWFQNIDLGGGIRTAPEHFLGDYPAFKFARFAGSLPADLEGRSVLDIGCNAGFYALEMKARGAGRVLGIDTDDRYLAQARLAADARGVGDVEFRNLSVYDVAALRETFDWVIFMGVLYHLRHPLLALDLIREHVAGDWLLFQTMQRGSEHVFDPPRNHPFHKPGTFDPPDYFDEPGYPKMHFIEHEYADDWTNWWAPNSACSQAMLRAAGFRVEAQIEAEVYLCRTAPVPFADMGPMAVYPAKEGAA
ncbi:TIGR04290 family methyltransferase [Erythrobacteraceae bacterium CFH 75059]|uniref:TIGR04290 family methyltransferase n=1 Tax=Qipengyuania thermophila TaxID=2509361 RepID=UPI00101F39FD|nr:TIGR04290 family methyltransferase [Qipengyuania thermophila]TCD05257.1 TIGR04290 family methyltransferase [Erythrobacteraceae bacterium CFH 75059]